MMERTIGISWCEVQARRILRGVASQFSLSKPSMPTYIAAVCTFLFTALGNQLAKIVVFSKVRKARLSHLSSWGQLNSICHFGLNCLAHECCLVQQRCPAFVRPHPNFEQNSALAERHTSKVCIASMHAGNGGTDRCNLRRRELGATSG